MSHFHDHFSGHAALYSRVRPDYPEELFRWLAAEAPHRRLAWDAGTGNGQAAVALAGHFERVIATDPSREQLAQVRPHPSVEYRAQRAEHPPVTDGSVALVTAAQAAHWFDLPEFFRGAGEALSPGGVVALWCYDLLTITPAVDRILHRLYHDTLGAWWPPQRALVDEGYRSIHFPVREIEAPAFEMTQRWDLPSLLGYLRSWSAAQRHLADRGEDAVAAVQEEMAAAWGDPAGVKEARFPLFLRVGRLP